MKQIDFAGGSISRNILQASLPMMIAQVLNLLYNIVDRIYIGQIPGEGALDLGAVGLCFPLIIIIAAFTNLYGSGGAPLCAMARGRGRRDEAAAIMNTSFYLLIVTGLVLTLAGLAFCEPLILLFGASSRTIGTAVTYMRIYLIGTIPSMIAAGMNPYINAQGFARTGMLTIFIGAAANIVLDPLFIFVFGLGVAGAAIATVISQVLSMIFVLLFLRSSAPELRLSGHPDLKPGRILNIVSLGLASFIMQCTNSLVSIACNHVLSEFGGDLYISVMTIITSVRQILDTPVMAITDGASPVLSFNYGAGAFERVRKAIRIVSAIAMSYTAVIWLLIRLQPMAFIRIFSSDAAILEAAVPALHMYFFAFIFQSLQYSGQMVFRSLNKKKQTIFFSLLRKVVIVLPLTYLLPPVNQLGASGVFMAEPISNAVGGSLCFLTMVLTVYPELSGKKQ